MPAVELCAGAVVGQVLPKQPLVKCPPKLTECL